MRERSEAHHLFLSPPLGGWGATNTGPTVMRYEDDYNVLTDFREKNSFFLYGYLRGDSPFEWYELDLSAFIDTIFHRGRSWEDCFEERQSEEYQEWLRQVNSEADKIDYTNYRQWRYNPIIFSKEGKENVHRILLKDDTETLQWARGRKFAIMPPATFVGRNNTNKNARYLYAIAIDLDGVTLKHLKGLCDMSITGKVCPIPNILVNSGHGLHVYYLLKEPVPLLDPNTWKLLTKLKENMTLLVWQRRTSSIKKQFIQIQPILQSFRLPGTLTKFGEVITAWENLGVKEYTLEELNAYSSEEYALSKEEIQSIGKYTYNPNKITLEEAKRQYPEWYERTVVQKKRGGRTWKLKRGAYQWWLEKIKKPSKERVGHRFWCVMVLFVYASRSDVPFEEAYDDAMDLLPLYDSLTTQEDNHFTEEDIRAASRAYYGGYDKFSTAKIEKLTLERIDPQRRNGRTQKEHLERARILQNGLNPNWRDGNGRPAQQFKVLEWRLANPDSKNKARCARELGLSRTTVHKWWCVDSLIKKE